MLTCIVLTLGYLSTSLNNGVQNMNKNILPNRSVVYSQGLCLTFAQVLKATFNLNIYGKGRLCDTCVANMTTNSYMWRSIRSIVEFALPAKAKE